MDIDLTTLKKNNKENTNLKWTKEQENLLASWSERAAGYRWLHSRSEKLYRCRNYTFTIPVIILSTLTGTANFAMDSFIPESHKQLAMACVGGVNIFAGILSTLQNFLRYAELMESHRVCEVSWSKLSRDIAVELTLEPKMRKPAFDFLNVCRAEYDRLIEAGPIIDDDVIKQFNKKFKNYEVSVPSICNGLDKCNIYKKDKNIPMNPDDFLDGIENIVSLEEKDIEASQPVQDIKIVKLNDDKNEIKISAIRPLFSAGYLAPREVHHAYRGDQQSCRWRHVQVETLSAENLQVVFHARSVR